MYIYKYSVYMYTNSVTPVPVTILTTNRAMGNKLGDGDVCDYSTSTPYDLDVLKKYDVFLGTHGP